MGAQSLPELLADAGIRLKSLAPGRTEHVICQVCGGGSSKEKSLSVTIDQDAMGATWVCHRATCFSMPGGGKVSSGNWTTPPAKALAAPTQKPKAHTPVQQENRPQWLWDFFGEREIGARTVQAFRVYAKTMRFPGSEDEGEAVVFPFIFGGELVNRKYRTKPPHKAFFQDKSPLPTLFNIDRVGDDPDEIVWCEGEMDVMALFECQVEHAVTLKDGAPKEATFKDDDKRFEALRTHAQLLARVRRFVLAGDSDAPGLALREELARRLGRHRCWLVTWPLREDGSLNSDGSPKQCKDACETLQLHGPIAVQGCIRDAVPYPIAGLQRIKRGTLLALRHGRPPQTMTTGARATDAVLHLPTEGRLIIVTGVPNHGKTTWTRFVMVHTVTNERRRWAVFSPEMQPWEQFAAECAEVFLGKPFWPKAGLAGMSDAEVLDAETWLAERMTMLVCDAEDEAPTVDWILDRAAAAVLRDGATDLLVDPFNEIDQQRDRTMTETDFIGRTLQRFKAFGLRHGCNVWVIAHPAKPAHIKPGETRPPPGPYDISASAHWANKADLGITVHSPHPGLSELHLWKTRFRRFGKRGDIAHVEFDEITGRYTSAPSYQPPPDGLPTSWHDAENSR